LLFFRFNSTYKGLYFVDQQEGITGKEDSQPSVGKLSAKSYENTVVYVNAALKKLKIEHALTPEQINKYGEDCKGEYIRVAILWTVKAMLGTIVESLLLSDRYKFLEEQGHSPLLVPVFEQHKSPRNVAVIAVKGVSVDDLFYSC